MYFSKDNAVKFLYRADEPSASILTRSRGPLRKTRSVPVPRFQRDPSLTPGGSEKLPVSAHDHCTTESIRVYQGKRDEINTVAEEKTCGSLVLFWRCPIPGMRAEAWQLPRWVSWGEFLAVSSLISAWSPCLERGCQCCSRGSVSAPLPALCRSPGAAGARVPRLAPSQRLLRCCLSRQDGGPGGSAGWCELFNGDGEKQIDSSCQSQQENCTSRAQVRIERKKERIRRVKCLHIRI